MSTPPTYSEIQNIITAFQDSGQQKFGTHAWSAGFLGATLANALYYYVPSAYRDQVLQSLVDYKKRNDEMNKSA